MSAVANQITVGLVEDHELARRGIRQVLSSDRRFKIVGEAASCSEAVLLVERFHPDIVILDMRLRQSSGIDFVRSCKTIAPNTKILVLTAYDYKQYVTAVVKYGVTGYLLKSASAQELRRAVRDVANGKLVLAPEIAKKAPGKAGDNGNGSGSSNGALRNSILTAREADVLKHIGHGLKNREIAEVMCIALKTVEAHVQHILQKMGAKSRTQAIINALRMGWLSAIQH